MSKSRPRGYSELIEHRDSARDKKKNVLYKVISIRMVA